MLREHRTEGFAVVLVVLIAAIALMTFLFASMTMTLTSRNAAAQDRASAQVLLAADSGLNTLHARASESPYSTSGLSYRAWVESFSPLNIANGVSAQLTVLNSPTSASDVLRVQSTGVVGSSRRTVIEDFKIAPGTQPISLNLPATLTSTGSIDSSSGAAVVRGLSNQASSWSFDQQACTVPENGAFMYGGNFYKVLASTGCPSDATVQDVGTGITSTFPGGTTVNYRPTAVMGAPTSSSPWTVPVTDGTESLFGSGSPIEIDGKTGTVKSISHATSTSPASLEISWDNNDAPLTVLRGDVITRVMKSAVTSGSCPTSHNASSTFPDGCVSGQPLPSLFNSIFNVSSADNVKNEATLLDGSQVSSTTMSGITWVTHPNKNFRDQHGSGVMVIENDPGQTITLNVSNEFTGLIYVIGNANIQGNGDYPGAVVVDGQASVVDNSTAVQGTTNLHFEPAQLVQALAAIHVQNSDPGGIGQPIRNTWRVK